MRVNFPKQFELKVKNCHFDCDHYYVEHEYKDGTLHYPLHCTNHGYLLTVPRDIAISNILDGAVVVGYENKDLDPGEYEEALYETNILKRKEDRSLG